MEDKHIVIAGCHKSGTTSLYTYLSWHPEIKASSTKETNFFLEYPQGTGDDYKSLFAPARHKKVFVEASPDYFYGGAAVAKRLKSSLPNVHVVILIRNPVDKIFEQFNHTKKCMGLARELVFDEYMSCVPFEEVLDAYGKGRRYKEERVNGRAVPANTGFAEQRKQLLVCGFLHDDLAEWTQVFSSSQMSVIWFDDLASDPGGVIRRLSDRVGFDPSFYKSASFPIENAGWIYHNAFLHGAARKIFTANEAFFRRHYTAKRLLRSGYFRINGKPVSDRMSAQTRASLEALYRHDMSKLSALLSEVGYNSLPPWLKSESVQTPHASTDAAFRGAPGEVTGNACFLRSGLHAGKGEAPVSSSHS